MNDIEQIILTLQSINNDIISKQNITLEDLKILLLIIYNEYILHSTDNQLINSYITIILNNFINLENKYAQQTIITSFSQILNSLDYRLPWDVFNS